MKFTIPCLSGLLFTLILFTAVPANALEPEEILVVANKNASQSVGLARYYMDKRKIPEENLVLLFMTDKEQCSREAYVKKAVPPIRRILDHNSNIRAIVTMYGVPLRIASPGLTEQESATNKILQEQKSELAAALTNENDPESDKTKKIKKQLKIVNDKIKNFRRLTDKVAAFDSEIALVKNDSYSINMWQANPFYLGFQNKELPVKKEETLMVSRLDGPDPKTVKRVINDTIEAEKTGLKGKAYFDARWKAPKQKKTQGYAYYDQSIHRAAKHLEKDNKIDVVLDDNKELFQQGQCPDTALYCGWYSLRKYIDAFEWQKGSVGFHIASAECTTLKNKKSQVWCKKMLEKGIAATVGPVGEPYVQAFPVPEIFFTILTQGEMSLAEAYLLSTPFFSWKMVLIGDPLYRLNIK